jgi:ribosomal protein S17
MEYKLNGFRTLETEKKYNLSDLAHNPNQFKIKAGRVLQIKLSSPITKTIERLILKVLLTYR